jgi:hypothetical protein
MIQAGILENRRCGSAATRAAALFDRHDITDERDIQVAGQIWLPETNTYPNMRLEKWGGLTSLRC